MRQSLQPLARALRASVRRLVLMGAAAALGGPAAAAELGRAVEPPPALYASGPTLTGTTRELTFPTPQAVQAFCNLYLGRPPAGYYQACYVPALDLVVLPDSQAWPSARERAELRAHEWAHARGWRHPAPAVTYAARAGARAAAPDQ